MKPRWLLTLLLALCLLAACTPAPARVATTTAPGVTVATRTSAPAATATARPLTHTAPAASSTPHATAALRPAATLPAPRQVDFAPGENWTPPEGVLEEIAYFGLGGVTGIIGCEEPRDQIVSEIRPEAPEWFGTVLIKVCNWPVAEPVTTTLTYPDGRTLTLPGQAEADPFPDGFAIHYALETGFEDPPGEYQVHFAGAQAETSVSVLLTPPHQPTLFHLTETRQLLLHSFAPHEQIQLLAYIPDPKMFHSSGYNASILNGVQSFEADERGQLVIDISQSEAWDFVVLGEISGEVRIKPPPFPIRGIMNRSIFADNALQGVSIAPDFACPGAPPPRLDVGLRGRVTYTDGRRVNLRAQAGLDEDKVIAIPEGTEFRVFSPPSCHDNLVWYWVRLDDGTMGWAAEGEAGNYYLEPYEGN